MSEVLVRFDEPQRAPDGRLFIAEVHGGRSHSGLWEAWIEFEPVEEGDPLRTNRETEQLTRGDLRYWSAGLTRKDLENALIRAISPSRAPVQRTVLLSPSEPDWLDEQTVLETNLLHIGEPAMDPFTMLIQSGEYALRQELRALDALRLRGIIAAYDIPEMEVTDLARTFEDALAERIVAGVQHNVAERTNPSADRTARPNH